MNLFTVNRVLVGIRRLKWLWWSLILFAVLGYSGKQFYLFVGKKFMVAEELPAYRIGPRPDDDTLRVAVIGDSWAEYHMTLECDTIFCRYAKRLTSRPVKCFSIGHSAKTTKEIYYEMFADHTVEHTWERDRCSQPLIEQHPDYCVLMAGINDMRLCMNQGFYIGNYRLMLNLLIQNGIRPVVMEMPDVDFKNHHENRNLFNRWKMNLVSLFTGIDYSCAQIYRDAMTSMLSDTGLDQKVLFIPMSAWNAGGVDACPQNYLDDRFHLNLEGYHVLDSCMAVDIVKDYQSRNK